MTPDSFTLDNETRIPSCDATDPARAIRARLDLAKAQLELAERNRIAAWDTSPGNNNMAHVFLNAMGYHRRFHDWAAARDAKIALERQLAALASEPETSP